MECALSTKRPSAVKQEPLFFCSCGCEMPTVVLTRTKTAQTENTNVLESVFSSSHALFWIVGEEAEEEINQVFFSPCPLCLFHARSYDMTQVRSQANCPISTVLHLHQTIIYQTLVTNDSVALFFTDHVTFWHPYWLTKLKWYCCINPSKLLEREKKKKNL